MSAPLFRVKINRDKPGERPEQFFASTCEAAHDLAVKCLRTGDTADIYHTEERLVVSLSHSTEPRPATAALPDQHGAASGRTDQ